MLTTFSLFDLHLTFEVEDERILRTIRAVYSDASEPVATNNNAASIYIVIRTAVRQDDPQIEAIMIDGPRLSIHGKGVRGGADATSKSGWCELSSRVFSEENVVVTEILDTIVLFLVTRSGRTPLHAAAIVLGDTALVLAGRSGVGKSTLALAAARAGVPILTDDTVYVQTKPSLTVWGMLRPVHVYEYDAPQAEGPLRLRAGRWKKAVIVDARAPMARRAMLCVLERGDRVALSPLSAEESIRRLTIELEPGFDHFRAEFPTVLGALAANGAWRMTLSANPGEAVALLRQTFAPSDDRKPTSGG